jgi:hypothetical protein
VKRVAGEADLVDGRKDKNRTGEMRWAGMKKTCHKRIWRLLGCEDAETKCSWRH